MTTPATELDPQATPPLEPAPMQHGQVTAGPPAYLANGDGVADFTPAKRQVRFRIDDDVYEGVRQVPALATLRYAAKVGDLQAKMVEDQFDSSQVELMLDLLRLLLKKESADRLIARLDDADNPVDTQTFVDLVPWLMEQYGLRPTEPSSDSPTGPPSPDGGTSSTASTSAGDSTSNPSGSTGS